MGTGREHTPRTRGACKAGPGPKQDARTSSAWSIRTLPTEVVEPSALTTNEADTYYLGDTTLRGARKDPKDLEGGSNVLRAPSASSTDRSSTDQRRGHRSARAALQVRAPDICLWEASTHSSSPVARQAAEAGHSECSCHAINPVYSLVPTEKRRGRGPVLIHAPFRVPARAPGPLIRLYGSLLKVFSPIFHGDSCSTTCKLTRLARQEQVMSEGAPQSRRTTGRPRSGPLP